MLEEKVELLDGAAILQLRIEDSEVVEWLGRLTGDEGERIETVKRALKVGIVAMSSAFISGTSQTIREALERWRSEVESMVTGAIQQSREQIVQKVTEQFDRQITTSFIDRIDRITHDTTDRIKTWMDDLEKRLEKRIDPNLPDSWLGIVQGTVDALKNEFDPSREGSYLWRIRDTLSEFYGRDGEAAKCIAETIEQTFKPLKDTLEQIRQGVDEIKVRLGGTATQRGLAFERESVKALLERATSVTGDECEHVGADNRPGDWLINVLHGSISSRKTIGRIVIEVRDTQQTRTQVLQSLDNAIATRNADVGILLFARPDQNPYGISFSVLDENYSKMVAVWDENGANLNFAYQLARLCILEKHFRSAARVDWTNLRQQVQDIFNEVNRMDELERQTRLAKERAEDAEEICREIRNNLLRRITRLQEAITTAAASEQ